MHKLRGLWARLRGLFTSQKIEDEFSAELDSHLAAHVEDGMRRGLTAQEARRQALVRLGGAEQVRQAYRDRNTFPGIESLWRDMRYALRGFRRSPVFAVTAIVTLALGIGATTAVFSVVDRILFRSLPYAHPEQLVSVGLTAPIIPQEFMLGDSYFNWEQNQKPFIAMTSEAGVNECDLTEHNPQRLSCASVEQNLLPTLGISPVLGRNFLAEEDRPNGPKVALISYGLWVSRFGHDPSILNRNIHIDSHDVRVVGVLPNDFEMPGLEKMDILEPEGFAGTSDTPGTPTHVLHAFARLRPGTTIAQAMEQLKPVFDYSLSLAPERFRKEVHYRVRSIRDLQMQDVRLIAWILLGAVVAVLLIACANVANLLLTRAAARERELAVRSAVGASRRRLVCQSLTESALLVLLGALAGVSLAEGLLRLFIRLAPSGLPFLVKAQIDFRILAFTMILTLICGVLFGVVPAMFRPRAIALAARAPGLQMRALLRRSMVALQIAASLVLLAGAALLVRSFANLQSQSIGMQSQGVLTVAIALNRERYGAPQLQMTFFRQAEAALRRLPGVSSVAISDTVPPAGYQRNLIYGVIALQGRPATSEGTGGMVTQRIVTPDYFRALDIPIIRGESFTAEERNSRGHYVILSSLLAARLFPGENPIGKKLKPTPNEPWHEVVGVAAEVKNQGLDTPELPELYRLRTNQLESWGGAPDAVLVVKTGTPPKALAAWVQSQIAQIDPTVPMQIETMKERVTGLADRPRFETALLSFFAGTGLLMALIGLYGVVAFLATQRTQEIGVRMALGASRSDVLFLILNEGIRLVAVGGAIGLAASLAVTRLLHSVLFNVGPHDALSFVVVTVLLAFVALIAVLIPARSAMRTDPMTALRWE